MRRMLSDMSLVGGRSGTLVVSNGRLNGRPKPKPKPKTHQRQQQQQQQQGKQRQKQQRQTVQSGQWQDRRVNGSNRSVNGSTNGRSNGYSNGNSWNDRGSGFGNGRGKGGAPKEGVRKTMGGRSLDDDHEQQLLLQRRQEAKWRAQRGESVSGFIYWVVPGIKLF